jgi:hypothetical protein
VALASYEQQVQRLLQNPGAPVSLYSLSDIDSWINTARGQVAAESRCIRVLGTLTTVIGQSEYPFAAINVGNPTLTGIQSVLHIRSALYSAGSGFQFIDPHSWEWFQLYYQNNPAPPFGPPAAWALYKQGALGPGIGSGGISSGEGTFFLSPIPDSNYVLTLDCVCYPTLLVDDTTLEAIPYLWTDAVPFFAAWYALLSSQMQARRQDAEAYYSYYQTFMQRARSAMTPDVTAHLYEQAPQLTNINKLGVQGAAGGGGGNAQ